MDEIRQQVARARRRLSFELFLNRLVKCWFATLLVAAAAIAIPKIVAVDVPPTWTSLWFTGALAAGALAALGWTFLCGRSELDAAIEIDRRFDLRERVASSLSLPPEAAATPAGQALLSDARRAIGRIAIDDRFRIRLGNHAWLPLGPAVVALVVAFAFDNRVAQSSVDPRSATLTKTQLDNTAQTLRNKLEEQRKEAKAKGLQDAEELLIELQKNAEKLADRSNLDKQKALVKLNDLKKQLDERRNALGGNEELRKQLNAMKDLAQGPADKMLSAMKNGDWSQAKQELSRMQQELASGKMSDAARKQLEQQVGALKQKLEQAAAERRQAMDELKKQIEQQKQAGNLAEAGKLQQKLDQMAQQAQQAKQLERMAAQMAQMQQALHKGDAKAAAQAMQQMQQQLEDMQAQANAGDLMDMASEQLENAKNALACKECSGEGCQSCQGNQSNKLSQQFKWGDFATGAGRGAGRRDEQKTDAAFRDSQVKQNARRGAAVIAGEAEGPTFRGDVREQIQKEMAAEDSKPADPLVIEELPKTHRANAEDYFNRFNRLRGGD